MEESVDFKVPNLILSKYKMKNIVTFIITVFFTSKRNYCITSCCIWFLKVKQGVPGRFLKFLTARGRPFIIILAIRWCDVCGFSIWDWAQKFLDMSDFKWNLMVIWLSEGIASPKAIMKYSHLRLTPVHEAVWLNL